MSEHEASGAREIAASGDPASGARRSMPRPLDALRRTLRARADIAAIRRSDLFAADWYAARYEPDAPDGDLVRHYVTRGSALGLAPHPLFDPAWYRERYRDVALAGIEPFAHYVASGLVEGRNPNPWFDRDWFAARGGPAGFEPLGASEAPHPFLSRRFVAEGGAAPLEDLAAFLEDGRGDAVGIVEVRTPNFLTGWIAAEAGALHPEIIVDGRTAIGIQTNPRPDVARLLGRPAQGFLYAFERPLDGGEEIVVRRAGGGPLRGSPSTRTDVAAAAAPAGSEVLVHLDSPAGTIDHRLVEFAGWIRLPSNDTSIEILVDGSHQRVFFGLRTDVIDRLGDPLCVGFKFPYDVAAAAARGSTALDLEIVVGGRCVERRNLPIELPPIPPDRPRLAIFMHIPKTAGVSVADAIRSIPDARALWLYDRGPMSVSEQIARLSPGAFDDLRFVGGHFAHGIHRRMDRPCDYVAFVRGPASHLKSYYLYMKHVARIPAFEGADIFSLLDVREDFDNAFTRWFAPVAPGRKVGEGDLQTALEVMERDFVFVGLVERMAESISRLAQLWNVDLPLLQENRTPPVVEAATIDLRELERRAAPNIRFDERLVAHAKRLFWS